MTVIVKWLVIRFYVWLQQSDHCFKMDRLSITLSEAFYVMINNKEMLIENIKDTVNSDDEVGRNMYLCYWS